MPCATSSSGWPSYANSVSFFSRRLWLISGASEGWLGPRAGDTMRNLICWCPQTHKPIDLQLFTDYATLARIWSSSVRFHCPHCGGDHETKVAAVCLQTTLARTALSETHEASEPPLA